MSNNRPDGNSGFDLEWVELKEQITGIRTGSEAPFLTRVWEKSKDNPLVPIGMAGTTFCLVYGLISMRRGDSRTQQIMMRGRVMAQGFTVVALISGVMLSLVNRAKQS